uniref:Protein artemis n=1 Tax=Anopheles atroparvus TaxID=41427 RepID=A0AAG5DTZ8_ANOAO
MSTFSGFIPELPGVAIDCFDEAHRSKANAFFLSHCHADHMRGLDKNAPLPGELHLSPISGVFIRHRFPQYANMIRPFNVGEQLALKIEPPTGEASYELYVRSLSAEHCPGSVMFYFETNVTRILYTGDFRISSQKKFEAQSSEIRPRIIYLDSTFLDIDYSYFPTRDESTAHITNFCAEWLAADKRNVISLWLPAGFGSEELFLQMFERLKEKIHISDKQRGPYMHFSSLNDVLTHDSSARIHACSGTTRPNRNLSCRNFNNVDDESFVRTIRPSALRWRGLLPTEQFWKKANDLFYVCYSAHASCDELGNFLRYFQSDLEDVRFNVIANETDRIGKEQTVDSILQIRSKLMSTGLCKTRIESQEDLCLNLNRIEYKTNQQTSQHAANTADSSESDTEQDLSYTKLPKRIRTD